MKINIINDLDSYSEILKKYNLVKRFKLLSNFQFITNYTNYYKSKLHIYLIEENNKFIISFKYI